jgi:hypothetical protein
MADLGQTTTLKTQISVYVSDGATKPERGCESNVALVSLYTQRVEGGKVRLVLVVKSRRLNDIAG